MRLLSTVGAKLRAAFTVSALVVVGLAILGIVGSGSEQSGAQKFLSSSTTAALAHQAALDAAGIAVAENSVAFDYNAHQPATGDRQSFDQSVAAFDGAIHQLLGRPLSAAERADITAATTALDAYRAQSAQIDAALSAGTPAATAKGNNEVAALAFSKITDPLSSLERSVDATVRNDANAASSSASSERTATLILGLLGTALAVILAIRVPRIVTVPLRRAVALLGDVAAGKLTGRLDVHSNDETGTMARSLNVSLERISGMIGTIADAAVSLTASSEELTAVSSQMDGMATEAAGRAELASGAVTEADAAAASEAIGRITAVIGEINDTQSVIASAVEEQTSTTAEITRSIETAASRSSEIVEAMAVVAGTASGATAAASQTHEAASDLARQATGLREVIEQFTY